MTVALNTQTIACLRDSGSFGIVKAPIAKWPMDSMTAAYAIVEMIGPYCVGNDMMGTGALVLGLMTIRC